MQILDVILFIRKHGVLQQWNYGQIVQEIVRCVNENTIIIEVDEYYFIKLLCLGKWVSKEEVYITALIGKGCLFKILKHLKDNYPECKYISCERHGKNRRFKVTRMFDLTK